METRVLYIRRLSWTQPQMTRTLKAVAVRRKKDRKWMALADITLSMYCELSCFTAASTPQELVLFPFHRWGNWSPDVSVFFPEPPARYCRIRNSRKISWPWELSSWLLQEAFVYDATHKTWPDPGQLSWNLASKDWHMFCPGKCVQYPLILICSMAQFLSLKWNQKPNFKNLQESLLTQCKKNHVSYIFWLSPIPHGSNFRKGTPPSANFPQ